MRSKKESLSSKACLIAIATILAQASYAEDLKQCSNDVGVVTATCLPEAGTMELLRGAIAYWYKAGSVKAYCDRYLATNPSIRQCKDAVDRMFLELGVDAAGFGFLSGFKGVAVFRKELVKLVKDPEVIEYLNALETKLKDHGAAWNFWDFSLQFAHGNRDKALQWIAVLFQDSSRLTHAEYLELNHGGEVTQSALDLLRSCNKMLDSASQANRGFSYFPPPIGLNQSSQYHFYVMAYLSKKLSNYPPSAKMAAIAPILLNTQYEYSKHEDRLLQQKVSILRPTTWRNGFEPKGLNPDKNFADMDMLMDIYLGYVGPQWGRDSSASLISFEDFKSEYVRDPLKFSRDSVPKLSE